jgi:hypothetical protein
MSLRAPTEDENRPSPQCSSVWCPMGKPLRSRPIASALRSTAICMISAINELNANTAKQQTSRRNILLLWPLSTEAYPSDTAVAHCPMRFHETPPHFQRRSRSARIKSIDYPNIRTFILLSLEIFAGCANFGKETLGLSPQRCEGRWGREKILRNPSLSSAYSASLR